jgi:FMN reductase
VSKVGVVVGNPKPKSRTLDVARATAQAAAAAGGLHTDDELIVDLADLGPQLFDWSAAAVNEAVEAVKHCELLVVASPTYKASYTGLLKSFLDWFAADSLAGVTTVPVMVGAGAAHTLAVEVHLRPVLVELGALLPTRGLFVLESDLAHLDDIVGAWAADAAPALRRTLAADI